MLKPGAALLWEALRARGVERVFGIPGSQNVDLYEALRRSGVRSVLATNELAAAFMAAGHHRASGRLAALVTIPGPGFTWALTGLAEALHDSTALLHVVGAPPPADRRWRFQAVDQAAIARPLVKRLVRIDAAADVVDRVEEAVDAALEGEPGPVVLEWTPASLSGLAASRPARAPLEAPAPAPEAIGEACRRLAAARRPVLLLGMGCRDAVPGVRWLAEWLRAPVATSLSGRGVLPEDHPSSLGFDPARSGIEPLNRLLEASDCVLVVGWKLTAAGTVDFGLRLPVDRTIRVDASGEVLADDPSPSLSVAIRAEHFLAALREAAGTSPASTTWTSAELEGLRRIFRPERPVAPEPAMPTLSPPRPATLLAALRAVIPRDGIVVTDSGQHQELTRRHFPVLSPAALIAPSDFQSMGFGIPAAIGAALACPGRPVVAVVGDGGIAMNGLEILTAVRERIPLTVIVLHDGHLGRIRLEQLASHGRTESVDLLTPDFGALAAAVGARHLLLAENAEASLRSVVQGGGVTLVEVPVGDSAAFRRVRATGLGRATARRILGHRLGAWLRGRRTPRRT